jgi:hypothetical protein
MCIDTLCIPGCGSDIGCGCDRIGNDCTIIGDSGLGTCAIGCAGCDCAIAAIIGIGG